ncbi:hypothetical protein GCM10010528_21520 [Gordonia defluvii]|uniref:Bacterioferritin comigratory protein n=1 Tax=Gordonia defluvii TaxID=283718 RepID=A0ABP6LI20_9ACTN
MSANQRLSVGDPAPGFTLTDSTGTPVSLADYAGRRVIVYFYPAAMTPGCTKQGKSRGVVGFGNWLEAI